MLEAPLVSADIVQWLYSDAVSSEDSLSLIEEMAQRMRAAKIPVDRITTAIMVLHPSVRAESSVWTSDGTRELRRYMATEELDDRYYKSPLYVVDQTRKPVRCRIPAEPEGDEFSIIPDLRAEGYTDYIAMPMPFSDGTIKTLTFASKAPGGFTDGQINVFDSVLRPVGLVCELHTLRRMSSTLLDTYVGPRAGGRVLDGTIKRGEGELISAVVSFADLRGYSRLSNELPTDKLITFLNLYFGAMTSAVEAHGGEVLKFIGDEVMAIFPYENEEEAPDAARRALLAARQTKEAVAAINTGNTCKVTPQMRVGIALHAGDVFFGNVGSDTRLDFTVIGPTVNLAARIAEVAKDRDVDVLVSEAVADLMHCRAGLYGQYQVKGFDDPVSVYSPSLAAKDSANFCPESAIALDREPN